MNRQMSDQGADCLLVAGWGTLHPLSPSPENRLTSNRGHSRGAGQAQQNCEKIRIYSVLIVESYPVHRLVLVSAKRRDIQIVIGTNKQIAAPAACDIGEENSTVFSLVRA